MSASEWCCEDDVHEVTVDSVVWWMALCGVPCQAQVLKTMAQVLKIMAQVAYKYSSDATGLHVAI